MNFQNTWLLILFFLFAVIVTGFYFLFDPANDLFFIPCPFKLITGYDCPLCGSQRAFHELLHGNLYSAFQLNPLFIISLPFIFNGIAIHLWNYTSETKKTAWIIYSKIFIYVPVSIIILFWIYRNLPFYPW